MVFESVVADLLNRFLGDYVENLDHSQLKIGIWGGDVVLENLVLKQNALDDLDLPVQTIFGHLGKLILKIPWKNLYGASVEASIEGLYLLVSPNREVKYDSEKEDRISLQNKQNELQRVEEAKKREAQKDEQKVDDSFVEKLATQIIKNVQLNIKDIHIRYEDKITNPNAPFSFGISLHNLSVNTTDDKWRRTVVQDAVTKIYKVLDLEGLALYWNPNSLLYTSLSREEILRRFQTEIATKRFQPDNFNYILGPISANALLQLNPKPDQDVPKFEIPKVTLNLNMELLAIGITKAQYQDIMKLADSMDRMAKGTPFRKYRPHLNSYRGHYKEWWQFAYTCIMESEVKRKQKNWDWNHICGHRNKCRQYATAYQCKLQMPKKISKDVQCTLDNCEKTLDLFNLVVIRQRIEMEVARLGKAQEEAKKNKSWFGSWWGGDKNKDDETAEGTDIMRQFEKAMTSDEKAKLFQAIDYQENSSPTHFPVEFIATSCHFLLGSLVITVADNHTNVLISKLNSVQVSLEQRPSANAIRVVVRMEEFTVSGLDQNGLVPRLVTSKEITTGASLLDVMFETNPLDAKCGQRIKVAAKPLEVVYDAQTIIKIVDVFKPPSESSALSQLQAAAESKFSNLKEKSALGLQHAVSRHTIVDIDIDFCSSYLILSHSGIYTQNEPCVVINLGAVSIKSAPRSMKVLDVHQLFKDGADDEEIMEQAFLHSYDKFILQLTDMQIIIANKGEDWKSCIARGDGTSLHLLHPTNLKIEIDKCLITDDYRLPKIKASGRLTKIAVNVSEDRLMTMLEILVSVPFPKDDQAPIPLKASESRSSSLSLLKYFDPAENKKRHIDKKPKPWDGDDFVQLTEIVANFTMDEFVLMIFRKSNELNIDSPIEDGEKLASFALNGLEIQAVQKTLMLNASVKLLGVTLSMYQASQSEPLKLIYTPRCSDSDQYLFSIKYCNVDKKYPDFHGKYGSVEQLIELDFRILQVLLHQEGIQELLKVSSQYQARLTAVQGEKDRVGSAGTPLSTIPEDEEITTIKAPKDATSGGGKRRKKNQIETIGLKVKIFIEKVGVDFANKERLLAKVAVSGFKADLAMKESYTQISAKLQDIKVLDQNPDSIHTKILSVVDGDAFNTELVIYNTDQYPNDDDISITAHISCMQILFLNWFVSSMLNFLNNFQAAQQAIKDASAMAAESAKANVQNAYEKATKVSMFIRLNAPIVIAPENSKSPYAVMVDFGQITLKNKFINIMTDDNTEVIIDELTMALENLKLSRVKLTPYEEIIKNEKMLLKPTTFNLIVKRNLSSWYDKLPDIDMSGRLKAITVTLSSDDMKMAMKVLSENLTEGSQETASNSNASARPQLKSSVSIDSRSSALKKSDTLVHAMKQKDPTINIPSKTLVKFTFTMDSLTIEMMNKIMENNELLSPLSSREEVGLARFSLLHLSMKGKMLSNNSLQTSILLVDCQLDDMRPHKKSKLTRFMERKSESGSVSNISNRSIDSPEKKRSMIDITFTQNQKDIFLDVRIFSFNLILSMDFMMKISDFVTNGLAIENKDEVVAESSNVCGEIELAPAMKRTDSKMYSRKVSRISHDQPVRKNPTKTETEKSTGMITINLKVEKPDILLVESMDDKDCRALVLNNEVEFKMRMTEDQKVMEGSIKELQLYTCTYTKVGKQDANRHSVLVPCNVSLTASSTGKSGWHVDIAMTDIRINVSPATIELLNRVMVTMTKSDDDNEDKSDTIGIYHDLWEIKPFQPQFYWFLKTEMGEEALESLLEPSIDKVDDNNTIVGEVCILSAPVIVLCIEAGLGNNTIPMLSMESSLNAIIKDWSSQLNVESSWAMQISYYNNFLALWEPLVEPVEVLSDKQYKHIPWELRMEVQMNKKKQNPTDFSSSLSPTSDGLQQSFDEIDGEGVTPQPNLSVQITSTETLEMTITNTALQVLTQLGNAFSNAVHGELQSKSSDMLSPYLVKNDTGSTIILLLEEDPFIVYERLENDNSLTGINTSTTYKDVVLESGASVPLQLKSGLTSVTGLNEKLPDWKLHIKIADFDTELYLPVVRADKRYFPVKKFSSLVNDSFGIISDVAMIDGAIHINIRSIIQVINNLSVPVEVYFMTETGKDVESLGLVNSKNTMNLPLKAVYTSTSELFFSVQGYSVSSLAFIWKDLQKNLKLTKLIHCVSRNRNLKDQFFMKAVGIMEQVFFADTSRHTMPSTCYNIYLRPAVVLQNSLPIDIIVSPQGIQKPIEHTVKPGETLHLPQVQPGNTIVVIMLPSYLEKCWVCTKEIPENGSEFAVWTFDSHDSVLKMSLELGMHCTEVNGSQHFSLYCPFWMLNKTSLPLAYKSSEDSSNVLYHPADFTEPILFSFKAKSFFGKKKASIRIENGEWSDKFSLDVPGSSGVVICNTDGKTYQVGVSNVLTYNGLTKQVIFTPYFLLINNAPFNIECQEVDRPGDPYIKIEAKSTKPFWPKSEKDNKLMRLRASNNPAVSAPFLYTDQHTSLLKLNNEFGGINVETLITEGCIYVTFRQYRPGLAPALIINQTIYTISLWEKESVNIRKLHGMHHMMYTWENPAGPRIILYEGHRKKEIENDLRKDGIGEFTIGEQNPRIYWISFLDGMQRVLLFTTDILIANLAHTAGESGVIDTEVTISLHGIGLSLVNNLVRQEILYMSIASSGIIWEQSKLKSNRYKSLNMKDAAMIEDAYQQYLVQMEFDKTSAVRIVNVDNKIEVDFGEMEMLKPQKRRLRRIMQPGLWAHWESGLHISQLHARLHRLQIDQQLPTPTFPVILAPVPPPKSVAASHGIKPFVELCIVERIMEHTNIKQYKYFKILVQEFHIKIDMDLINALMKMFPEEEMNERVGIERFALDLEVAGRPLESLVAAGAASEVKHFYDQLHLSPLKVHVSFSLAGATQLPTFIGTLLQGLGVTLTDMNDVIFKLAYYERVYEFLSQKELISTATSHYTGQALKQLYVLVLGLDVIGNPYGLVIGLTKGVEDLFYEPFQGAIQGPGEFAEGLMLGVRSLFGHTVGGAAGAVSRITGAMGHGLAALSLDEEYQRKRRDNINKPPANLQEGIARSGKGLLMGVVDGVTGVFTKPISGARDEGVGGFFKGLGKGAVGLIARPTAGVVDFASGSLDAVKRAADTSSEIVRHRPARSMENDGLVRPYSRRRAEGFKILRDLDKGKYVSTDIYETHIWIVAMKEIVLCTDKRIAYLEKNSVFGGWQILWSYTWQELPCVPLVKDKGVFVQISQGKRKLLSVNPSSGKLILIHDEQQRKDLVGLCERMMRSVC